ncbi:MAG: FprA family A-type flavoprotein [Nitrososphaeria archaeon]
MSFFEISKNVYWVGVKDWNRRMFDALIPLPRGTSYNSYLIVGEKKLLVDTVNPGFEGELKKNVDSIVGLENLDYLVMNHAEPDHAGAIPYVMGLNGKVKLLTTLKGAKMAQTYYNVPSDRINVVKGGDVLELGRKTLRFIEAPMLHWPETMFTYLQEDKILFSCDFFGAHLAEGFFDDDVEDLPVFAQKYFGEIMMPFKVMGKAALEKLKDFEVSIIAPSHGPIYKNPDKILGLYRGWVEGVTREKVVVVYVSMWGSTECMAQTISKTLLSEGVNVLEYNLSYADLGDLVKDLVDARAVVLAAPTVLNGAHPLMVYFLYLFNALRPPTKYCVILSSFGWAGGTVRQIKEAVGANLEILYVLDVNGRPNATDLANVVEAGRVLAKKVKGA